MFYDKKINYVKISYRMYEKIDEKLENIEKKYNIKWMSNLKIDNESIKKILKDNYLIENEIYIYRKYDNRLFLLYKDNNFEDERYKKYNLDYFISDLKYFSFYDEKLESKIDLYKSNKFPKFVEDENSLDNLDKAIDQLSNKLEFSIKCVQQNVNEFSNSFNVSDIFSIIYPSYLLKLLTLNNCLENFIILSHFSTNNNMNIQLNFMLENPIIKDNIGKIRAIISQFSTLHNNDLSGICFKTENFDEIDKFLSSYVIDQKKITNFETTFKYYNQRKKYLDVFRNIDIIQNDKTSKLLDLSDQIEKEDIEEFDNYENWNKFTILIEEFKTKFDAQFGEMIEPIDKIRDEFSQEDIQDLEEFAFYNYKMQIERLFVNDGFSFSFDQDYFANVKNSLDFELTTGQTEVFNSIINKMKQPKRMRLLIQGDVGSGKTILTMLASLNCVKNGKQVLIVVHPKVLQEQHFKNYKTFFDKYLPGTKVVLQSQMNTDEFCNCDVIVGGIGLYKKKFSDVGLIIFDEPHLLSIGQKDAFQSVNSYFDLILTTATPQPRTQVLSLISSLELEQLKTLPNGRLPVITRQFDRTSSSFNEVTETIKRCSEKGEFIFVVVNRKSDGKFNVNDAYKLYKEKFPNLRIEMATGDTDNSELFKKIKEKQIDMLISTNIIKVGVDISHATAIIIHYTGWMGVSDLHQLRGRVGRNSLQSYAFIEYPDEKYLDKSSAIGIVLSSNDNIQISKTDLEYRGIKDLIGEKQSGGKIGNVDHNDQIVETYLTIAEKNRQLVGEIKWTKI